MAAILLIPLILYHPEGPEIRRFSLTLLDVGQGLAAVIRTRDHVLLYDTGPRYGGDFDAGQTVIAPYLRHEGISMIDAVVISHGDRDHIGGFASLCRQGKRWIWDGVAFEFLHPPPGFTGSENDRSCVLKVGYPGRGLLLPGDIEAAAESVLIGDNRETLRSRVLVAPHHGSETSSTAAFLREVGPDAVLFPVGYRNRFGFPRPAVVERYRQLQARLYDTAQDGAIEVYFSRNGDIDRVIPYRPSVRRYWHWRAYFNDPE